MGNNPHSNSHSNNPLSCSMREKCLPTAIEGLSWRYRPRTESAALLNDAGEEVATLCVTVSDSGEVNYAGMVLSPHVDEESVIVFAPDTDVFFVLNRLREAALAYDNLRDDLEQALSGMNRAAMRPAPLGDVIAAAMDPAPVGA